MGVLEVKNKCKLYNTCKQRDTDMCNRNCWKYVQLNYQLGNSNIPKGYLPPPTLDVKGGSFVDVDAFRKLSEYQNNIFYHVNSTGMGAYIYGRNKGNGKTSWAIKILFHYFRQLNQGIETFEQSKGLYINVPILFKQSRDNISNPSPSFKKLEKQIQTVDLLILDDIGTEAPTQWVKENLYVYITSREMENKATIYTSNLSLSELEQILGGRIVDRIYKQVQGNIIMFKGTSRRR